MVPSTLVDGVVERVQLIDAREFELVCPTSKYVEVHPHDEMLDYKEGEPKDVGTMEVDNKPMEIVVQEEVRTLVGNFAQVNPCDLYNFD